MEHCDDSEQVTVESHLQSRTPQKVLDAKFFKNNLLSNPVHMGETFSSFQTYNNYCPSQPVVSVRNRVIQDSQHNNRFKIQPAVVEMMSQGPEDLFKRQKMIYFQPQSVVGEKYQDVITGVGLNPKDKDLEQKSFLSFSPSQKERLFSSEEYRKPVSEIKKEARFAYHRSDRILSIKNAT